MVPIDITALNLRDLKYLVAVSELRHFGKAARLCHVSQPALSGQIRKVEDLLRTQIFERSRSGVTVTPAGEAIVRQARVILDESARLADLAGKGVSPLSGTFRLGVIASLGPYYVPHLLKPLRRAYPKLELVLREGLTDSLISDLRERRLDAVLASPTFEARGLTSKELFFEPFVLALPCDHRLAVPTPARPEELRAEDMILLEEGHCLKDQAVQTCPPRHRTPGTRGVHATSMETLRQMIASGLGYSLVPELASGNNLGGLVVYRRFTAGRVGREIALFWRPGAHSASDAAALAALARGHLPAGVLGR